MKIKFEWEKLESYTYRAKAIGGWIVKDYDTNTLIFVPDQFHEWQIEKLREKRQ